MMKPFLLFTAVSLTCISCGNAAEEQKEPQKDTIVTDCFPPIEAGSQAFPEPDVMTTCDTFEHVDLISQGEFHGDEVEEDIESGQWYSLFFDREFSVEQVDLTAERVYDPIVDETEDQKTGWKISSSGSKEPVIMMRGIELREGMVVSVKLPEQIYPGDSVAFDYEGKPYLLFASGVKGTTETGDFYIEAQYALYLQGEKDGKTITQELVYFDFVDEGSCSILFCGDLDGDGFPDLLLNSVPKYNSTNPTLYLSGEAADGHLLQVVGWRRSVGC